MKNHPINFKKLSLFILVGLIVISGCAPQYETAETEDFRISKISDYPVFEIYYLSDHRQEPSALLLPNVDLFACSLFNAANNKGGYMMGRNFDWEHNPAVILHASPSNGYESISMVNLGFIGIGAKQAENLMAKPALFQSKLKQMPFVPVDGMNERGVAVGMAMVPAGEETGHQGKPMMGSLGIMREILDYAANVEEALAIMDSYHLKFGDGPAVHYLISDASGDSAVVEYGSGEMHVIRKTSNWQAITNFLLETAGDQPELACSRFQKISEKLTAAMGSISVKDGMRLLADVSQGNPAVEGTQWSALYDLAKLELNLSFGKEYARTLKFSID
jgi:hypothetical protein